MKHKGLLLPFIFVYSGVAIAEFDTKAYCREVASFGGTYSYSLEASCRQMENSAKKRLEAKAARTPAMVQVHCEEVAQFGGQGSYSLMESCIKMELDAKRRIGE